MVESLEWPIWPTDGLSASMLVPIWVAKCPLKSSTQDSSSEEPRAHVDGSDLTDFLYLSLISRLMQTHADFGWLGEVVTS